MNLGIVRTSPKLIIKLLGYPPDCELVDARVNFNNRSVEFVLSGECMPDVLDGCQIPVVHLNIDSGNIEEGEEYW